MTHRARTPRLWLAMMVVGGVLGGLGLIGAVVAPIVAVVITTKRIGDIHAGPPPEESPGSMMFRWTLPGLAIALIGGIVFLCAFLVLRRSGAARPIRSADDWNK